MPWHEVTGKPSLPPKTMMGVWGNILPLPSACILSESCEWSMKQCFPPSLLQLEVAISEPPVGVPRCEVRTLRRGTLRQLWGDRVAYNRKLAGCERGEHVPGGREGAQLLSIVLDIKKAEVFTSAYRERNSIPFYSFICVFLCSLL